MRKAGVNILQKKSKLFLALKIYEKPFLNSIFFHELKFWWIVYFVEPNLKNIPLTFLTNNEIIFTSGWGCNGIQFFLKMMVRYIGPRVCIFYVEYEFAPIIFGTFSTKTFWCVKWLWMSQNFVATIFVANVGILCLDNIIMTTSSWWQFWKGVECLLSPWFKNFPMAIFFSRNYPSGCMAHFM
mgnify:CR=1 FL=1